MKPGIYGFVLGLLPTMCFYLVWRTISGRWESMVHVGLALRSTLTELAVTSSTNPSFCWLGWHEWCWPNWRKRCAWTGQYAWPRHLEDMEHCLYAIQQGIKWRAKTFTKAERWHRNGFGEDHISIIQGKMSNYNTDMFTLMPSKRLQASGITQARLAWNRYGLQGCCWPHPHSHCCNYRWRKAWCHRTRVGETNLSAFDKVFHFVKQR